MAYADGAFHAPSAIGALVFAFLIQIGTNFCNDYADFKKGADTAERTGPLRVTQAGLVSPRAVLTATTMVFALAAAVGVYLVVRAGWPFVAVVALSVICGVLYTAGPFPLGYLGLGDLFVLVFFGPVAVVGTYYVQTLTWNTLVAVAGIAPGLLSVAILVVNNLRDVEGDAKAGKRTLAVRFGKTFARFEYLACIVGAVVVVIGLVAHTHGHLPALLALAILPLSRDPLRKVFGRATGPALNPVLSQTAKLLLIFSLLFSIGWVIGG